MMRSRRSRSRVRRDAYELGNIMQRVSVLSRRNLSLTIVHDLDRDYPEKLKKKKKEKKKTVLWGRERETKEANKGKNSTGGFVIRNWGFSEIPCHGRDKKQK